MSRLKMIRLRAEPERSTTSSSRG
ncbi:hypothetical protein G210_4714 [Candida maltosa Xu316]|uniref:Uncharacterized protein n=1 Tax=Candida maltosa (strain Xu316) TaxID=1245528 RepID=M3K4Q7_CANMX|nr:hypothetical protein G210_4714 [Candida maltosa Xu316]